MSTILKSTDPADYEEAFAEMDLEGVNTDEFIRGIQSENEADRIAQWRVINDDYATIQDDISAAVPGLVVNPQNYIALSDTDGAISDISQRIKEINNLIQTGNSEDMLLARSKIQELAGLYPDVFGSPEDYNDWDYNDFSTLKNFTTRQAHQANMLDSISLGFEDAAVDYGVENVVNFETLDADFDRLWNTSTPKMQQELLDIAGIDEVITSDDKARIMSADTVRGLRKATTTKDSVVRSYLENASDEFKEWYMAEPEAGRKSNADYFEDWVFDMLTGGPYELNEDGTIKVDSQRTLPPMNLDSSLAHRYFDWPMGTFDEEGTFTPIYSGFQAKDDDNWDGDPDYQAYSDALDERWEAYRRLDGQRPFREWFIDAQPVWDGDKVTTQDVPLESRLEEEVTPVERLETRVAEVIKTFEDVAAGTKDVSKITPTEWEEADSTSLDLLSKAGIIIEPTVKVQSDPFSGKPFGESAGFVTRRNISDYIGNNTWTEDAQGKVVFVNGQHWIIEQPVYVSSRKIITFVGVIPTSQTRKRVGTLLRLAGGTETLEWNMGKEFDPD